MVCVLLVIIIVWVSLLAIDFIRAILFKKPIFVIPIYTRDDGGSGKYLGIGYWFDIKGNFLPESEEKGIVDIRGYVFGYCVINQKR